MNIRVTGKNLDISDALQDRVIERVEASLGKYFDGSAAATVSLEREGSEFRAEYSLSLSTGLVMKSSGSAQDAYAGCDLAADRLEKQLRRYNRKLKNHRTQHGRP